MTVLGKEDVILALPLIREALHAATFAKIEIDTDCVTLYIDVDVKALVQLIEYEKATKK